MASHVPYLSCRREFYRIRLTDCGRNSKDKNTRDHRDSQPWPEAVTIAPFADTLFPFHHWLPKPCAIQRYNQGHCSCLVVPFMSFPRTLGTLRISSFSEDRLRTRRVKDELRENLIVRLREMNDDLVFNVIV